MGRWHEPRQIHLQFREQLERVDSLYIVWNYGIKSRSHLAARPTPTDTVWGPPKVSHTKQQVHNKGAGAGWGYEQQGKSWQCVKSQVNVCWHESHIKDDHSFRFRGTNGKPPHTHTYTHVVRLRGWQCVAHVWMLYIVYAEKYPTYSLKTAPLPRLAKPVSLTHSVCVYKSISCFSVYNKQYVTRWASGSAHYFSLLPAQLHSGISPAVLDMVVGEHMSGLEQGQ